MNANAKLWVEALRSGKFQQTRLVLERDGKQCCLGVACRVAMEHGVKLVVSEKLWASKLGVDEQLGITSQPSRITTFDGFAGDLPDVVRRWLGLSGKMGTYSNESKCTSLADANDSGASFAEIADIIESEPDGLFKVVV